MTKQPQIDNIAGDRPVLEIEITEEMIEAGVKILEEWKCVVSDYALILDIYRAMEHCRELRAQVVGAQHLPENSQDGTRWLP